MDQLAVAGVEDHSAVEVSPISSGSVNAESAGPRRAAMTTSRTAEVRSAAKAVAEMSVRARCIGVGGQDPGDVECDVAVTDDHDPFVAEIDGQFGEFGMAVDPGHCLGSGAGAGQTHTVDVEPAVVGGANRVQHGVMVLEQLGVGKVFSDLHVEIERESAPAADPVEQPVTPLVFW